MKKKILLSSLLVLSIVGCTSPMFNNTSQYSDLDKEYSQFKTEALTQSYLKKKMDKWISDSKYSKNLVREIEYAKFKHPTLLKDILVLQPTMFNSIIGNTNINQKRSEPSFENFIEYIDPFPSDVIATSATNITSSGFTANWNSVSNATGYKLYIDGSATPITLGNVTSYNKTGLVDGSSHTYYVKAINSAGESSVSNTINLTLLSAIGEFKVNSFTTNDQTSPSSAMAADGSYVVTWRSNGQDGDTTSDGNIYAQKFNSNGSVNGGEFRVNTYTTSEQGNPSIAMADDGKFVITWHSRYQDGSDLGTYAQKYNANGSVNGGEFRVNTYTTSAQYLASIAMADDGRFVITWESYGQDGNGNIYAQKYNADGTLNGSEFLVNTYTTGAQRSSSVTMSDDGKFVISWQSDGQDGNSLGIYAQKYNSDGTKNASEFKVNTYTTNSQQNSSTAIASDGSFIITWESRGQDGDGSYNNVYAQKYNADGSVNGSEFLVNTYTTNSQYNSSVTMSDDGKFVISWQDDVQDGWGSGIYAQKYNADGSRLGSEFKVNTYTTINQTNPSISINNNGNFIVAWQGIGNGDDTNFGIFAKRFDSNGNVL